MNRKHPIKVVFITVALGWGLLPMAQAQLAVSQMFDSTTAVVDEYGVNLKGNEPSSSQFGVPHVLGCVVQVLHATDGTIYPPTINGEPHPANTLLETTRIGIGVSPTLSNSGLFSTVLTKRPGGNSKVFVRVFNAPDLEEASFYGDSGLFTVKSWVNEVFASTVAATDQPLDSADDDGDGLNNSWEQSMGSDAGDADTDGDSFTDGEEFLAGTDMLDAESLFEVGRLMASSTGLHLEWDSAPGKQYLVEYIPTGLDEMEPFQSWGSILATDERTQFEVPMESLNAQGCFRICVVE